MNVATATPQNALKSSYTFTVFPDDLNYAGTLFGGKLLAEMDLAASNSARRILYNTQCNGLVTAHLGEVDFLNPAYLGDIIELKTQIIKTGKSSIQVEVKAQSENLQVEKKKICQTLFIMVALKDGQPYPHLQSL